MDFSLEQLRCFSEVAEAGSLNLASERLNKAKSAVSYSVNKLEEQLGFMLFERGKYRLKLTAKGAYFLSKSEILLDKYKDTLRLAHSISDGVEMKLAVSCSELYPLDQVLKVLSKAQKAYPDTELIFNREILSGEEMLRKGFVDIAIFEHYNESYDFQSKPMGTLNLKLSLAKGHPFLKLPKKEQTFSNLIRYPQIVQRSTLPSPETPGVVPETKKWNVTDMTSKKQLIMEGLGWGRLPEFEIEKDLKAGRLVNVSHLKMDVTVEIFLCRKPGKFHGQVSDFLWENLSEAKL